MKTLRATNQYLASATERQIQRAICDYLDARNIPFSITNASLHFENGKPRRRVSTDGWFDVTCCATVNGRRGAFVGIEVKSYSGRLRPAQAALHERVRAAGGVVIVARSVDDVERVLRNL